MSFLFIFFVYYFFFFFFFQAEDGIRDADVTRVQTCALPIFRSSTPSTAACRLIGKASPASPTCWCWIRTASSSGSSRGRSGPDRKLATLVRRAGVATSKHATIAQPGPLGFFVTGGSGIEV